jgi:hypothetical protein
MTRGYSLRRRVCPLDDSAADKLAAADANVDDALKCEGKAIGGMHVECLMRVGTGLGMVVGW